MKNIRDFFGLLLTVLLFLNVGLPSQAMLPRHAFQSEYGHAFNRALPTAPCVPMEAITRRFHQSSPDVHATAVQKSFRQKVYESAKRTCEKLDAQWKRSAAYQKFHAGSCSIHCAQYFMSYFTAYRTRFASFMGQDPKGWKLIFAPGTVAAGVALLTTDNSNDNSEILDLAKRTSETEEKSQDIVKRRGLEMVNWSGLYTDSQYLPARLEENDRDLEQAILKVKNLERELAGFRRKRLHGLLFFDHQEDEDRNNRWVSERLSFSVPWKRTKVARALELKDRLTTQKREIEIARHANSVLQGIQSKNRTGPQGAQESMDKLVALLQRYAAEKRPRDQEEFRHTVLKALNLRAILHLESIEFGQPSKEDIKGALSLFNAIMRDSRNNPRISPVYCNKGFFLYSYPGDLTNAEEALKEAHRLSPVDPLILMHRGQCAFRLATYTPPTLANQAGEFQPAPARVTPKVLEEKVLEEGSEKELYQREEKYKQAKAFIDQAANRGPRNYLIRQVRGKLLPKFLLIDGAEEDPLGYNATALAEFQTVHQLLQDKSTEIKDGLDVYYYFSLARVHAVRGELDLALRYFEHSQAYLEADYDRQSVFFLDANEMLEHAIENTKRKRNKPSERAFLRDVRTLSLYDIWQASLNLWGWSTTPPSLVLSREEEYAYRKDLLERDIDAPLYGYYFAKPKEFEALTPKRLKPPREVFGEYAQYAKFAEMPREMFIPVGKTDEEQLSSRVQQLLAVLDSKNK